MSAEIRERGDYACRICGAIARESSRLCRPSLANDHKKFCGDNALRVCIDKRSFMKYKCDACNSVSANPERLCSPSEYC